MNPIARKTDIIGGVSLWLTSPINNINAKVQKGADKGEKSKTEKGFESSLCDSHIILKFYKYVN